MWSFNAFVSDLRRPVDPELNPIARKQNQLFNDQSASTLAVFSHPNHELAILGLLQRLRPNIIVLTDGGGGTRVTESQKGLESIDLLDQATFLNFPEASFYDSLCARDHSFFKEVAERVFNLMDSCGPGQILCDAVEFYNPVHDLSLPIDDAAPRPRVAHARSTGTGAPGTNRFQSALATADVAIQRLRLRLSEVGRP